jgi:hypothetical protein
MEVVAAIILMKKAYSGAIAEQKNLFEGNKTSSGAVGNIWSNIKYGGKGIASAGRGLLDFSNRYLDSKLGPSGFNRIENVSDAEEAAYREKATREAAPKESFKQKFKTMASTGGQAFSGMAKGIAQVAGQMMLLEGITKGLTSAFDKNLTTAQKWQKIGSSIKDIGLGIALQAVALPPPVGLFVALAGLALAGVGMAIKSSNDAAAKHDEDLKNAQKKIDENLDKQTQAYSDHAKDIDMNMKIINDAHDKEQNKIALTTEETNNLSNWVCYFYKHPGVLSCSLI